MKSPKSNDSDRTSMDLMRIGVETWGSNFSLVRERQAGYASRLPFGAFAWPGDPTYKSAANWDNSAAVATKPCRVRALESPR